MGKPCTIAADTASDSIKERVRALRRQTKAARRQDADGIHDLRVASRRVRVALKEAAPVFGRHEATRFEERVREVTRLLGKARELDVSLELLERRRKKLRGPPRYAATHTIHHMRALRKAAAPDVGAAAGLVESPAFDESLLGLFESLTTTKTCYLDRGARSILKQFRRLRLSHEEWRSSQSEEDLHAIRIRFKKLRYACEVYGAAFGPPMKTFIRRLKQSQEVLGQWNDYRVLRDYVLEAAVSAPPRAAEGFPQLRELLERDIAELLDAFPDVANGFFSNSGGREVAALFAKPRIECPRCRYTPPEAPGNGK